MSNFPTTQTGFRAPRALRVFAWVSFVLNVVIIATGGAVRLTGSGLGCTEWPLCTADSLITTPEMGVHGIIEFGNRTISGPLLLAAIIVFVLSLRVRHQRRDLPVISGIVLGLVALQALIGGFVVWMHLNANLVGVHYVISLVIVCIAAAFLVRLYEQPGLRERAVTVPYLAVTHLTTVAMAVTILIGVLTTGAGPHSGDENVVRDGFDATLLSHYHAWPGYIALALTVTLVVWAVIAKFRTLRWTFALLASLIVQIVVGVYQARNGLPPFAVGVHMVLASLTAAAMTVVVLRLKRPVSHAH
ncbi:MAG: heme A synthase [Microbacteriaceae bacterium]|nr:heme A synthase [Microbacteriaceae bacterium]